MDKALTYGDKHTLQDPDAYVSVQGKVTFTSELESTVDAARTQSLQKDLVVDLSDRDRRLADWMAERGFHSARLVVGALRRADLHPARALAMLTMETGNCRNIYGHDPVSTFGCYAKGGTVTEDNYKCYKRHRGSTCSRGCQGVGPVQLTWFEFQDRADAIGGCWKPYYNMVVGFAIFRAYRESGDTVWEAAKKYNGSGAYADRFVDWDETWQRRLDSAGF